MHSIHSITVLDAFSVNVSAEWYQQIPAAVCLNLDSVLLPSATYFLYVCMCVCIGYINLIKIIHFEEKILA